MPQRRFPPPWSVEKTPACFIVRDSNGQQLAHVYFEDEPGRRSAAKLLSKDEARRIEAAGAFAQIKMPRPHERPGAKETTRVFNDTIRIRSPTDHDDTAYRRRPEWSSRADNRSQLDSRRHSRNNDGGHRPT